MMRKPPSCMSKSQSAALNCAPYYANRYLSDEPAVAPENKLGLVGSEFHEYRKALVYSLVHRGIDRDWKYWEQWSKEHGCERETLDLIRADRFVLPHENVIGVELFLSMDRDRNAVECGEDHPPGYASEHPDASESGTLDLLMLPEPEHALIWDVKSGFSTKNISPLEPAYYAALVKAHFPKVRRCTFVWEFPRHRATRTIEIAEGDFEAWIWPAIRARRELREAIVRRYEAGERLEPQPWAGLCPSCNYRCEAVASPNYAIGAVTSEEDAERIASQLMLAQQFVSRAREALAPWVEEQGTMLLGNRYKLEMHPSSSERYPLNELLPLLGLPEPPEVSPEWDVPLSRLTLSKTQLGGYARAKKREGLAQALSEIAQRTPRTELRITKIDDDEAAELMDRKSLEVTNEC